MNAHFGINAIIDEQTQTGITALNAFDSATESNPMIQKFGEECLTCHINASREKVKYLRGKQAAQHVILQRSILLQPLFPTLNAMLAITVATTIYGQ